MTLQQRMEGYVASEFSAMCSRAENPIRFDFLKNRPSAAEQDAGAWHLWVEGGTQEERDLAFVMAKAFAAGWSARA